MSTRTACQAPDSCDRGDLIGIRDYAILMLVARLGLRSAEVARLELGDINWRAGQIILRGKACRQDGMPLPDVGEAVAAYLSQARPATPLRQVFLATKAPMRAIPPGLVSDVTHRDCDRAGLARIGAHRHRLAKLEARLAYGFRNPLNQRRRVRIACTRGYRRRSRAAIPSQKPRVTGRQPDPG